MNERENLICEVGEYFNRFNGRHYIPVHEGNIDEMYAAMVKEKAEFEQTFNRDLATVWNRPDLIVRDADTEVYPVPMDEAWTVEKMDTDNPVLSVLSIGRGIKGDF